MESSSVIVLDSDSDDGVIMENPSNSKSCKRKAPPSLYTTTATTHTGTQLNGTSSSSSVVTASGVAQDPPERKRIKPITIASNLSENRWSDGKTPPHNNNNNNQPIIVNENFAPITYSEDWEKEIKQYQQKLAGAGGNNRERSLSVQGTTATVTTATSCRSSTTTNDDSDPNSSSRGTPGPVNNSCTETQTKDKPVSRKTPPEVLNKNPIGKEFQDLLDACRAADGSNDMEKLIKKKLIRHYEIVHPDYVNSRSFKKAVVQVTANIRAQPKLVYLKVRDIVEELNARRKSRPVPQPVAERDNPVPAAENDTTGDAKKDRQIAQLNKTLYVLMKRIHQMEQEEVDFGHETSSSYLITVRYKKRAVEVYEKLCEITGENKNAYRLVRKPIKFEGTQYTEFNYMLSRFINRTNSFPDFPDVLKCLKHCNIKHDYGLRSERMNQIAYDAHSKVGNQLQKRRKTELYETVMYHAGEEKDPATVDPKLHEKLEENRKHYSKVNSIIDQYVGKELGLREKDHEKTKKSNTSAEQNNETMPSSSKPSATATSSTDTGPNGGTNVNVLELSDDDDDDDDDDEDDDDDDDDDEDDEDEDEDEDDAESTTKENVRPDSFENVVISDDEELIVLDS